MRAVIYARYSTDLQRDASIEDQVRICRQRIDREGWTLVATYSDSSTGRWGGRRREASEEEGRFARRGRRPGPRHLASNGQGQTP
jgi:DNA invertase Pin-like site-specific DNA recombinase